MEKIGKKKKVFMLAVGLMLLFSSFAVGMNPVSAQGDGFDDAEEITPGTYDGEVNETNNPEDFYKIYLESDSIIYMNFTALEPADLRLRLWQPDRETEAFKLESSNGATDSDAYFLANETDPDYWFIEIDEDFGTYGNYTFDVGVTSQNDADSGQDAPGSFNDAYEVEEGEYSGVIRDLDEVDTYKVHLESDSIMNINFTAHDPADLRLRLWQPDRETEAFRLESSGGAEAEKDYYLRNETDPDYWYIEIDEDIGTYGEYTFGIEVTSQDDAGSGGDVPGSFSDAYEVEEGEHSGIIRDLDEVDMYKVHLESDSIININFTAHDPADLRLRLWHPDRETEAFRLESSSTEKEDDYYLRNETDPDYWYIEIDEDFGTYGEYTFGIEVTSQDDAGSGGDAPGSFSEALEVEEGEYNGAIQDLDEEDMYKVWLEPDSVIEIEFISESTDGQGLALLDHERNPVFDLQSSDGSMEEDSHTLDSDVDADFWFIGVGGNDGHYTFNVTLDMPEPEFDFSNLRAEPDPAHVGEEVELKLDVSNVGTLAGDYTVEFYVDDESVGEDTVEDVGIDETKTATVIYTPDAAGDYTAEAENLTADFTVEEAEPANFSVEIVDYDEEVAEGDDVTVTYNVNNTGGSEGTQTIVFTVDDVEEDSEDVNLSVGEEHEGEFTWTSEGTGDHDLVVASDDDDAQATVTVLDIEPAYFEVEIVDYDEEVTVEEDVEISYLVTNTGEAEGTQTITLTIAGTDGVQDSEEVTLEADGESQETFTWTAEETGDHDLIVASEDADDQVTVTVLESAPAEFEFSNLRVSSSTIDKSQDIELMLDVTNVGDETGDYTVEFYVEGEPVGTDTVTVDGGETETASVTHSVDEEGTYTVTVDETDDESSFEVIDAEGFIGDLFARGMMCLALAIIIPIVIIIIIIVVVIKMLGGDEEEEEQTPPPQQQQQTPPPEEQPPEESPEEPFEETPEEPSEETTTLPPEED
ncbi:MAG: CARDB domain-containing protein [Candidatus Natronoplasma sp.]